MNHSVPDFDVAIIGGGPAGASMGCYLAKAGVKCVVFERELFPRPHVGESLVPSSTRVFKDLDFLPQMEEAKFPHKFGAVWTTNDENPGLRPRSRGPGAGLQRRHPFRRAKAGRYGGPELHLPCGPRQVRPDAAAARPETWVPPCTTASKSRASTSGRSIRRSISTLGRRK